MEKIISPIVKCHTFSVMSFGTIGLKWRQTSRPEDMTIWKYVCCSEAHLYNLVSVIFILNLVCIMWYTEYFISNSYFWSCAS